MLHNLEFYKTFEIATPENLFKEKNSKFFGYGYPITTETEVKPLIDLLKKAHSGAGHFCYAYQIGTEIIQYRANDDGEPNNSAGLPIYGQIQSFNITNVLIVVVRYFGGTKLGVGGLILAYKKTSQLVIESALIIEKPININYKITFDYSKTSKVMRIINENNIEIIGKEMNENCLLKIAENKKNAKKIFDIFKNSSEIKIE